MENKNVILLTVVSVATLLTAVVGASFAYFSTQVTTVANNEGNKVQVTTKKMASTITFTASGDKLELSDIAPGEHKTMEFTIANGSEDTDAYYNIKWSGVSNNFNEGSGVAELPGGTVPEHPENNLVYQLTCTGGTVINGSETVMPLSDTDANAKIATGVKVNKNSTASCSLVVTFKETNESQNYNQNRSFSGTVVVTTDENK